MSITQNCNSYKFDWQNFSDELNGHLNKYDGRASSFLIHTNLTGLWTTSILHKESKLCFMCGATTCSCQTKEISGSESQRFEVAQASNCPIHGHPLLHNYSHINHKQDKQIIYLNSNFIFHALSKSQVLFSPHAICRLYRMKS